MNKKEIYMKTTINIQLKQHQISYIECTKV